MKNRHLILKLAAALLSLLPMLGLTSCMSDDDYWPYAPPSEWGANYFYDSRLDGYWQLVQSNSSPVSLSETNYMAFNGNGRGIYYWYLHSQLKDEDMAYYCQRSASATTNYKMNLQYADGGKTTVAYWFTDANDTLWLQWQLDTGQTVTYLYKRIAAPPR